MNDLAIAEDKMDPTNSIRSKSKENKNLNGKV
jgi:hypothetical protein